MNTRTINDLQYFVGKVCTIFTHPINRSFDELRSREHFVDKIREINTESLWGTHPYNHMVSFFRLDQIILIQEEVELDPNNPDHAKMIQDYENKTGKKVFSDVSPHVAPEIEHVEEDIQQTEEEVQVKEEEIELPNEEDATFVNIETLSKLAAKTRQTYNDADKF